jgi:uncharacterized protein with WD repeat
MNHLAIKQPMIVLCMALSCAWAAQASAMSKDEYKAGKDRIEADYKAQKQRCDGLKANAKDICISEAKGNEKVAKAELEAQYKPDEKTRAKVMEAKADAAYDTAKEKCDDLAGNAKDVCVKDAKAAHVTALGQAKVQKTSDATSMTRSEKVAEARKDANADQRAAEYSAAKERCDSLAGAPKDRCIADAKARYGV